MLNLRSPSRQDYFARLVFIALFCLAVHCVVAYVRGARGREVFGVGRPEHVKTLLVVAALVAGAAFVIRPEKETAVASPDVATPDPETVPPPVPAEPPAPAKPPVPAEPPPPVAPSAAVAQASPSAEPSAPSAQVSEVVPAPPAAEDLQAETEPELAVEQPQDASPQVDAMVERMWETARKMEHNFIPNTREDGRYLSLLHSAALAGHTKAQEKLGEYAFRRGKLVEAYYWFELAMLNGMTRLETKMRECRKRWSVRGCPPEYENVYELFTDRQSALGRAVLRLDSGVQLELAKTRLQDMANEGEVAAVLILQEHGYSVK